MTRTVRRLAIGIASPIALTLALSACGSDDVSKDKFTSELEDKAGLSPEVASCVTDRLYDELDQGQINDLYSADTEEEAGEEATAAITAATTECITADG